MAINKKLIHFQTMANFEAQLSAGNILDTSIVFIKDAKKIWTHGEFYDCSSIKKFIFTQGFTFDEDSFEEYKNADEFYYYDANRNIYIELYKLPSDGDYVYLSGGTNNSDTLITVNVSFYKKDGSYYSVNCEDLSVTSIVSDALTDAGLAQQEEYFITEPIYDGMVLENLSFDPFVTKQLKLFYQSYNEEFGDYISHDCNLYKAHGTADRIHYYYGYYNNKTIICVTEDIITFTCLLNLIPIGGGEGGGYDDTEIKGQISEIEATIGDINTILESIIGGGSYYYGLAQYSEEELLNIVDEALEE